MPTPVLLTVNVAVAEFSHEPGLQGRWPSSDIKTGNEAVTDWLCFPLSKGFLVSKLCPSVAPNKQMNLFPALEWGKQIRVTMTQNHSLEGNSDTKA